MPIQGLQIDVKSDELKNILKERLEYHEEKVKVFEKEAVTLKSTLKNIEEDMAVGKVSNSSGNLYQQMENAAKDHKNRANYFKFMLDHVVQNDTYRLAQEDLYRLGISTSHY